MRHAWAVHPPAIALVGREAELEGLLSAYRAARAGHGRIALISGEPGIGKTALLASLLDRAEGDGARLGYGAAEELEQRVPFAAVSDCLGLSRATTDGPAAEVAALLRGERRPSGGISTADAEFLIAEAILGLVDGWCAAGPVVLAVDDLQWADQASLLVLHRLGRVAAQLPLLVAATRRSGAGGADLDRLVRSWEARGAELLELGPLDERAAAILTAQVTGAEPAAGLLGLIRAAAGNPLYVTELARAVAGDGQPSGPDAGADNRYGSMTGAAALPESLIMVVTHRLAGLSGRTREVLQVTAVLGPSFTVAELSAVLAAPALEFLGVIQEATAAGVLVAESDRLAFRHEVIRQALYESLPVSARNALHLQVGQALAASGAPVERAGQHLLAGMTVDAQTVTWLAESADRLTARAPELAADLLRRVLDAADPADDQAGQLRLWLATAMLRGGRFAEAEVAAAAALGADPDGKSGARLRWILVHCLINQGRASEALAEARLALDGGRLTRAERARFHGMAAQCLHVLSTGPGPALLAAEGARDEGVVSGDAHAMAYGLQAIAGTMRWHGRFREALELADLAAGALQRAGSIVDGQLDPYLIRANCLVDLDRDGEAQEAYAADLRSAERGVGTFFLCFHHLSVARMYFLTGRWDDALTEISLAREVPDRLGVTVHLDGVAALIAAHRQDREEVGRLRAGLEQPLATGTTRHTYDDRSWGRGLAAWADGDQSAALDLLLDAWQQCVAGDREHCGHYLLPDLAAIAVALGQQAAAGRAVAQLDRYAADREVPALRRSVSFAAGILSGDAGILLKAADAYAAAGRPLLEGQAREHAADILAAAGNVQEARAQLAAAQDRYAGLDAVWDAARADARLRARGVRRGTHGPRQRPKAGWAALTETERRVATLLAEGLSNPEIAGRLFTSRRTVQFHVSNILAKLGLSSRIELATLVARGPA